MPKYCPYCFSKLEPNNPNDYYCPACSVTIPNSRAQDDKDLAQEVKELETCKAELTQTR